MTYKFNPTMRNSGKLITILLLAIFAGIAALIWYSYTPEPTYNGKTLKLWLDQAWGEQPKTEARDAIKSIGTNAIPTLLNYLRAKDSPMKLRYWELSEKYNLPETKAYRARDWRMKAWQGFQILGPIASNAAPALLEIYTNCLLNLASRTATDDYGYAGLSSPPKSTAALQVEAKTRDLEETASVAGASLYSVGAEAKFTIPTFLNSLLHTNFHVRARAAEFLGEIHRKPEIVVPRLIQCLSDTNSEARIYALNAIKEFNSDAREAIPVYIKIAHDTNDNFRIVAYEALIRIGATHEQIVSAFNDLIQDKDGNIRLSALAILLGRSEETQLASEKMHELLSSIEEKQQLFALDVLANMPAYPETYIPLLRDKLSDKSSNIRSAVCKALTAYGTNAIPAVPDLHKLLDDPDQNLHVAAQDAIRDILQPPNYTR